MKLLVLLSLLSTTVAQGFSIDHQGENADYELRFKNYPQSSTRDAVLCSTSGDLNLKTVRLWMIMPNGHEHGTTPMNWKQIDNSCFKLEKLNFVMPGKWQLQFWEKDNSYTMIPLFVAAKTNKFTFAGKIMTLLLPPSSLRYATDWMFCGLDSQPSSISLSKVGSLSELTTIDPKQYGGDCYAFSELPLSSAGSWNFVLKFTNGTTQKGKVNVTR